MNYSKSKTQMTMTRYPETMQEKLSLRSSNVATAKKLHSERENPFKIRLRRDPRPGEKRQAKDCRRGNTDNLLDPPAALRRIENNENGYQLHECKSK